MMRWVILACVAIPVLLVLGFCWWAEWTIRRTARTKYRPRYADGGDE